MIVLQINGKPVQLDGPTRFSFTSKRWASAHVRWQSSTTA